MTIKISDANAGDNRLLWELASGREFEGDGCAKLAVVGGA